ncbi:MAG: NlpC/P60 family protein [Acidimicrobiales bacterium]
MASSRVRGGRRRAPWREPHPRAAAAARPHAARRRPRRHRGCWLALCLLAFAVPPVLSGHPGSPPAGAQTVEDARERADALEAELFEARERVTELAEEYNRATADLEAARARIAETQTQLERNQQAAAGSRNQLQSYAIDAYVAGGPLQELDGVFASSPQRAGQRLSYLRSATGDRQQLIDDLAAANAKVQRQQSRLGEAEAAAEAQQLRLAQAREDATGLEARTADLLTNANGALAELVAQAAARRAEEERAAAVEIARRAGIEQAAQAAQAVQAALAPATPAATPAPGGSNPSGSASPPTPAFVYTPPPGLRPEAAVAVLAALSQLGVPYVFGGESPEDGFDCSGLTQWAWWQAGVSIARPADYQRDGAIPIRYEDLQPGDLVFYGEPPSHMGMYIGNDEIVNAPQTGEVVSIKTMWYSRKPMTYGRVA